MWVGHAQIVDHGDVPDVIRLGVPDLRALVEVGDRFLYRLTAGEAQQVPLQGTDCPEMHGALGSHHQSLSGPGNTRLEPHQDVTGNILAGFRLGPAACAGPGASVSVV